MKLLLWIAKCSLFNKGIRYRRIHDC